MVKLNTVLKLKRKSKKTVDPSLIFKKVWYKMKISIRFALFHACNPSRIAKKYIYLYQIHINGG